ncbi:hypothetical protein CPB84DRAFT_1852154 [Gymnopilus junonius]|uniref:Uncharacterized protein n=1 Tax=Gymnopilus junonius TaxID=109634 RepID=A0A9P5TGS3_GYMJU|nr:hypothetical protein CPB84DRAFT_1852154 [Gymnopilus junonius]
MNEILRREWCRERFNASGLGPLNERREVHRGLSGQSQYVSDHHSISILFRILFTQIDESSIFRVLILGNIGASFSGSMEKFSIENVWTPSQKRDIGSSDSDRRLAGMVCPRERASKVETECSKIASNASSCSVSYLAGGTRNIRFGQFQIYRGRTLAYYIRDPGLAAYNEICSPEKQGEPAWLHR